MITYDFYNRTHSADIHINIKAQLLDAVELQNYENCTQFNLLCETGCVNYHKKWSCPPFTPTYRKISSEFQKALLILMECSLDQFNYTKTEYMKMKASNSILKSKSDKLMRHLESELSGLMLSNGSCRLCKPCALKNGSPCKRPDKMRYSMEALGLNVEKISLDYFNHKLLWYTNKTAPKYSTVISCLLISYTVDDSLLNKLIKKVDTL